MRYIIIGIITFLALAYVVYIEDNYACYGERFSGSSITVMSCEKHSKYTYPIRKALREFLED